LFELQHKPDLSLHGRGTLWRRLAKFLLASLVMLLILLVVLLHVTTFVFSLHDRSMKDFPSQVANDSLGHKLHYYELNQANAEWNLLFIHGTPATAAIFGEQFRHPFPRANLIALDRPGFGASRPARRWPSLDDQANAVGFLLSAVTNHRTILVGHSYGGPIALLAALKFTNRVAGVVLIGGSVDPALEHTYPVQRIADWPLISWLLPQPLRQCNRELLTLRSDLLRLQPQLARLSVPVVMLHGAKDRQVPVENVAYLREQLAAAWKTDLFDPCVFPGYNHFIPWEHPDAVQAALHLLTSRLSRRSPEFHVL
jgi:pimeloyl-ACP methyl ester carboxylesterase